MSEIVTARCNDFKGNFAKFAGPEKFPGDDPCPCSLGWRPKLAGVATQARRSERRAHGLMLWHIMGYKMNEDGTRSTVKLPCRDVPVMAILKEFRAMAEGVRGRKAHRPQEVPKYEYEKHCAVS